MSVNHDSKLLMLLKKLILIYRHRPVINYYNTDYERNVLISYIVSPFKTNSINYAHTNHIESLQIAEIFRDIGFNVDIYNYDFEGNIDYSKYSAIFGFGEPLINSYYRATNQMIAIYYGTGMHVCVQNHNSLKRVKEIHAETNKWLPESGRIVDKAWSIQTTIVDAIITLGNEEVLDSYKRYYEGDIYNIPVTYYSVIEEKKAEFIINNKNYNDAKYHFLWFGSSGLIHKGLDLLLKYFSQHPDLHLHICGPVNNEKRFQNLYYDELYKKPNIHTYGFVDLTSDQFQELMAKCLYVIFPSCSEGEPSSVINLMANGIIPVVTKNAGIRIKDFGYLINSIDTSSINETINTVLETKENDLKLKSLKCFRDTRSTHSIEAYSIQLKKSLMTILKDIL
jgi:hypothetical protein